MENDYNNFLMRLKEERIRCGLTQTQLGHLSDLQQSSFSRSETGRRRFTYHELKGFCASGVDVFYSFTGNRAMSIPDLPEPPRITAEGTLYHLSIVYLCACTVRIQSQKQIMIRPAIHSSYKTAAGTSFDKIREQLRYLSYLSDNTRKGMSLFCCVRHYHDVTQRHMADLLGMDIKTLRNLEKGRRLPDSEVIWKLYQQFQVSPVFVLMDADGMWNELKYVLGLLKDDCRENILRILENGQLLMLR